MAGGQRLGVGDVQCGAPQASGLQGAEQGVLVEQRPACGVDEQRPGADRGNAICIEEPTGLGGQAQMQADHVDGLEQRLDAGHGLDAQLPGLGRLQRTAPGLDPHAQRLGARGDGPGDRPEADQAERLTARLAAQLARPVTGRDVATAGDDAMVEGQHQTDDQLGHGIDRPARGGGDGDAALAHPRYVDVVEAGARLCHQFEFRGGLEEALVDRRAFAQGDHDTGLAQRTL